MAVSVYQVPVVFQDLRSSESLLQVFDALEYLESVVDDVFGKIDARVQEETTRMQSISQRLDVAQSLVQQITGSAKATTVMSASKYPANDRCGDYEPLYCNVPRHQPDFNEYDIPDRMPEQAAHFGDKKVLDEVVRVSDLSRVDKQSGKVFEDGLGRLPEQLASVSDLLLFNTTENPYKNYASLDNLMGKEGVDRTIERKGIGSAPKTITEGDTLPSVAALEYGYKPKLGAVPEFDLPSTLPNLPNVAEIDWSVDGALLPSIAPSSEIALPPVAPEGGDTPADPAAAPSTPADAPPPPPPDAAAPPPPPPPDAGAPPPPPPPDAGAPPPPPPPAAMAPADDGPVGPPEGTVDLPFEPDDGRNALLASIRNPGKTLRKVTDEDRERKEVEEPKASSGGGDVFGALIRALHTRRAGIRGDNEGDGKKGKKQAADEEDDDEDDWQD